VRLPISVNRLSYGTAWERTPWLPTQRAAWEAKQKGWSDVEDY